MIWKLRGRKHSSPLSVLVEKSPGEGVTRGEGWPRRLVWEILGESRVLPCCREGQRVAQGDPPASAVSQTDSTVVADVRVNKSSQPWGETDRPGFRCVEMYWWGLSVDGWEWAAAGSLLHHISATLERSEISHSSKFILHPYYFYNFWKQWI